MDYDWELSKENIQPRKEGRDMTKLVAGLNTSKDHDVERLKEQHEFELALQVEDKEDQLDPWYRYVIWTEQNFPAGSSFELKLILERCIRQFHKSEKYKKYKEDKRLVQMYLKYADILKDPSDVFDYMFDQHIGMSHASLYENWATVLEVSSNYKKADEVYQLGIARNAQPLVSLQRQYQQFLARLAAKVKEEVDDNVAGAEDQRGSLAALKKTRHGKVSNDRVKGKSAKVKGGLRTQAVVSQVPGNSFPVFEDGACSASSLPTEKDEWRSAPEHSKMAKENTQRPGKWTSAKVASAAASSLPGPSFAIHEDSEPGVVANQSRKPVVLSERKPLSSKKVSKEEANRKPMQKVLETTGFEPVVRYRKAEVYCGGYEFSLEELRALNPKYAIGAFTNYYPCAMEETCAMSILPPGEVIVPDIPQCQMAIEGCAMEENDIQHGVCETARAASKLEEEPLKKPRQRLRFSPVGCIEKNEEEVLTKEAAPLSPKITQDHGIHIDNKKDSSVLDMPSYKPFIDKDCNDGYMKDFDVKEFDTSLAGRTQPKILCKEEAKILRNWDLTKIEGVDGETGTFYGPVESTGVYDLQTLPRNKPVEDKSAPPVVHQKRCDTTPLEDEDLDNGNFSVLLASYEKRQPAKMDIPCGGSCGNGQYKSNRALAQELFNISSNESTLAHVDGCIPADVEPEKTKTAGIPSGAEKPSLRIQHLIPNEFARSESKSTSSKASLVPTADNEEPREIAKYSKQNVDFSIFEDSDSILSTNDVKTDPFNDIDAVKKCPKKLAFSIFEDREMMNQNSSLSQGLSHASPHDNTKQTPCVCGVNGLSLAASSEAKLLSRNRLGSELLSVENDVPSRSSKEPASSAGSAKSCTQGGDFSIFSDCADDIQAFPSAKSCKLTSFKNSSTANELGEAVRKDSDSIGQKILTNQDISTRSNMKRLPCKELTPLSKQKQARIDHDEQCESICMPTPLTQKANQQVFAMFNMTPECEKRDLSIDTTLEVTDRFEQLVLGQKCVVPASQASQPKFEIFDDVNDDGEVVADKEERQRHAVREGHQHSTLKKTNFDNSDMHNTPSFGNFSSTRNGITASTFCYPATAPPAFAAEIGELGCTSQNEKTEHMSFNKRHLSPIEELSGESKGSACGSTGKASFSCRATNSESHAVGSHPGKGMACLLEKVEGQNPPPAFDISAACNQSCYIKCSKHCTGSDNLEESAPKFSLQLTHNQIEEESGALPVDNTRCTVEHAPVNPTKEIMGIVTAMDFEDYPKLHIDSDNELKQRFAGHCKVTLGNDVFIINKKIASGGFSLVYASFNCKDKNQVVLKVMESCEFCQWEFYIAEEIHGRIDENSLDASTHEDFIQPISGYIYSNGAVIQFPFYTGGTLLDLCNSFISTHGLLNDVFALFYGLNVCRIIKTLHDLSIIHGDVKPDNFLVKPINRELMDGCIPNCLTLTDFGKCIDLKMFPENITFIGRNNTEKFECIEMQRDKPWKYQVDYYGIACTLFVAYHGTYMECFQINGKYKPTKTFRRPERNFWFSIMDRLINVGDCNDTTVLDTVIEDLETNLALPENRDYLKKVLMFHSQFASK